MENEDKNQEIASKTPVNEVPAATRNIKIEALLIAAAIAIGVIVAVIVSLLMPANSGETFEIKYGASEPLIREKGTLIISLINTRSYGSGNTNNTKTQAMIEIVPTFYYAYDKADKRRDVTILPWTWEYDDGSGTAPTGYVEVTFPGSKAGEKKVYQKNSNAGQMYCGKLRIEWMNRTYSNNLFWEIFRFGIVGLVAAVFDFLTVFAFRFGVFGSGTDWYVTLISTTCGFIVGVTINYLMSTYMVYKASKSNLAKTAKGVIFFVVLSAIGLGIGIGLEYLLYDFFFLNLGIGIFIYPVVFVVRTLVVMVYNYLSRKLLIYR